MGAQERDVGDLIRDLSLEVRSWADVVSTYGLLAVTHVPTEQVSVV
jgi:hypothetical protein